MLIAFKLKLLLACAAGLAGPLAVAPLVSDDARSRGTQGEPAIVEIARRADLPIARPAISRAPGSRPRRRCARCSSRGRFTSCASRSPPPTTSSACEDGACHALDRGVAIAPDRPAVQVSWHDAQAYAGWLSRKTGHHYRLPTDAEWAFAAGTKFRDDGAPVDADDPSKRWISRYERESERDLSDTTAYAVRQVRRRTSTACPISPAMSGNGPRPASCARASTRPARPAARPSNCGVRVAEGAHRAYVTDFIRDARAGGCAQGVPPANLGFRLVREERSWVASVSARWGKVCGAVVADRRVAWMERSAIRDEAAASPDSPLHRLRVIASAAKSNCSREHAKARRADERLERRIALSSASAKPALA